MLEVSLLHRRLDPFVRLARLILWSGVPTCEDRTEVRDAGDEDVATGEQSFELVLIHTITYQRRLVEPFSNSTRCQNHLVVHMHDCDGAVS